jgi:ATP-binding cassette subfamily B multidrug efflux pump
MNKPRRGLTRLMPFLLPQLKVLLLCLVMVVVVNAAELAKPYILEVVIDRYLTAGRPDQGLDAVWVLALSYMACVALSSALNVTEAVMVNRMGQSILMDIRRKVFTHIQHMSMRTLDHFSSGRLITRATNDVETLNELFSDVLVNLFKDAFMLLGIVTMMLIMNWRLALVAFAVVPLIVLITVLVRGKLRRNFVKLKSLTGRINGFFSENMSGMRLVQIFRREKEKNAEFEELNVGYYKAARTQVRMNSFMRPLVEVVNQLGIAILLWYGCGQIGLGTLEIGMLYAFTNYIKQFFEPINDLAEKYTTISSAVVSTDRIFELLDDEGQLEDTAAGEAVPRVLGRVEFEHVWFAYEGENWVLKDVSFTIEPGQSVAFVGTTGAGKSTIISLISRFYTIQRGRILLDGRDISALSLEQLRRHVAVVLQDVFLFSGSIAENIRLGNQEITDEEVRTALELACADGFIRDLPGGMNYPVTERGSTFSAGQRQLLSFARAIAHDPAVFVLDEATASIDTDTEQLIQRSVRNVSRGRTTIIIAHRLSTIRDCDCIYVLRGGRIREQGTHEQLMAQGGIYFKLHNMQMKDA